MVAGVMEQAPPRGKCSARLLLSTDGRGCVSDFDAISFSGANDRVHGFQKGESYDQVAEQLETKIFSRSGLPHDHHPQPDSGICQGRKWWQWRRTRRGRQAWW